eukprot:TRINITY_DN14013_c0_g1_i1.p1 TRINITY_DN14013_c0_g1~~TRINITY_DN14013_c0_g1_i1.p1  ORF type:complete len:149 (+),score=25.11 TRINITY_DN14013_c0_g1_i1:174-620(+)
MAPCMALYWDQFFSFCMLLLCLMLSVVMPCRTRALLMTLSFISRHAMSHQSFADDTQLHQSGSVADIDGLMAQTRECIADLKTWMTHNKLQLNDDKTEFMLACPKKFLNHPTFPTSIQINDVTISFSPSVRSLGVTLDQKPELQSAHI